MFVDTHMHERTCSKDSFLKLEEMVEIAREKGLGAICITDHDDMGLKEYAAEYSKKTGFPIFVGIEFFSLQGDIIAFGIEEYPDERISAQDFIDLVKAQGGFCFAAHPFRNNNRGLEENLRIVKGLDGLEVLNGSTSVEACHWRRGPRSDSSRDRNGSSGPSPRRCPAWLRLFRPSDLSRTSRLPKV